MNEKEQVIFEKFIDDHGAFLTSLSLEDNPEVIIAIMGENLNDDHPSPADFGKQMSVAMPEKDTEKITEVKIWFSEQTEDAVLAYVIQSFLMLGSLTLKRMTTLRWEFQSQVKLQCARTDRT